MPKYKVTKAGKTYLKTTPVGSQSPAADQMLFHMARSGGDIRTRSYWKDTPEINGHLEDLLKRGLIEHMDKCTYEDCQEGSTDLVESRKLNKVIKTCYKHAEVVVEEENPEYTINCPYCGCWIPIN